MRVGAIVGLFSGCIVVPRLQSNVADRRIFQFEKDNAPEKPSEHQRDEWIQTAVQKIYTHESCVEYHGD